MKQSVCPLMIILWVLGLFGLGIFFVPAANAGVSPLYHPADANQDYRMTMSEAIYCLTLWQRGQMSIANGLRAYYLWANGEYYHYDSAFPPPLCWEIGLYVPEGEGEPSEGEDENTRTVLLPGDVPLKMMWISAGSFMMGRYPGEEDSYAREDPQHLVTLPGFWMGKYEVTKAQWQAVMGTTPWSGKPNVIEHPNSAAVYISWNMAKDFINRINQITGLTFRLPSEAEWEYACRAGTETRFYWGDDPDRTVGNDYCWWSGNAWNVGERYVHIVGQKLPNAFGLYDMIGNAGEKCEDDWHTDYMGAPTDGQPWVDTPRSSKRVVRGGSVGGSQARSAYRIDIDRLSLGTELMGVRIAL